MHQNVMPQPSELLQELLQRPLTVIGGHGEVASITGPGDVRDGRGFKMQAAQHRQGLLPCSAT